MRSFGSLALRQIRARKARALLTAAGIVLGVAMILAVLSLSSTLQGTFRDLFDSVYGRTDLIVSGADQTALKPNALRTVRRTEGVEEAAGRVLGIFSRVEDGAVSDDPGSTLNVAGEDPAAADLTDSQTVAGHRASRRGEISLQESWAEAEGIEVGERIELATPSGVEELEVVGLFQFSTGLDFGGEGFALMAIAPARDLLDRPDGYDEVAAVVEGGEARIDEVRRALTRRLPRGVQVQTPAGKSEDVEEQLQAFNVIVFFFAAMALFVGGFLIFNAFNMTVLQRTREIGVLRTLGATRGKVVRVVLAEAAILGILGAALGLALGVGLAFGLLELLKGLGVPIGALEITAVSVVAAVLTGIGTAVVGALYPARRAGRVAPVRAVLGTEELRARPRPRRAALGVVLIALGGAGAFWLGAADETTSIVVAAGMAGTVAIFLGIALVAPFLVSPLVRLLSWPLRRLLPAEGRLAAEAARSDPGRTAATATGLLIGLALVIAINSLGSSFLGSIEEELDRNFARDLTVQPRGLAPGEGPQQTIARSVRERLAEIPEAEVVAAERFLFTSELPGPEGGTASDGILFGFDPARYEQLDETEIEGAEREEVFDRIERGEVTVGRGHADEFEIEVGDVIELDGPSGSRSARVAGIVSTVLAGGQTVGMSIETLREVYGVTADSALALKAVDEQARPVLRRKVDRIIERDYPNLESLSNDEFKASVESRFEETFGFFNAIVGVAVIASLFGIVNTLSMSVFERTREIGVLRALGSSRWQVRRTVASESLVICLIGALLGIAVGAGIGYALLQGLAAGVPGVSYRAPVETMVGVTVAGVVLGLIASVLPARRAARLDVVEALSYE